MSVYANFGKEIRRISFGCGFSHFIFFLIASILSIILKFSEIAIILNGL